MRPFARDPMACTKLPMTRGGHFRLALIGIGALLAVGSLGAQTVYRIVGADGRVTFSDKPPLNPDSKVTSGSAATAPASGGGEGLPFELRRVASQFPVTLYSTNSCPPCDQGRQLLRQRGVPFTEKTVTTALDGQALEKISGSTSLPFLTIGGQQIPGYADSEWTQYLNAAGYPESSRLPANYVAPAATPLVPLAKPVAPGDTQDAAKPAPPPAPPVAPSLRNPNNPAGIQF